MSKVNSYKPDSAVANLPKITAAAAQAAKDKLTVGTHNNTNPHAGGGASTFISDADDGAKATTGKPETTKPGTQADRTGKAKTKAKGPKIGSGNARPGATTTTGGKPRSIQRPTSILNKKASLSSFGKSSKNMLSQFHRARGTFRYGIKSLVRSFSLKSVLRGIAKKAPRYLFRVFEGAIGVALYALDSTEAGAAGYPAWYERYRTALSEYLRSDDPAAKMNALRKMNVAVYTQQENDSKAFIVVMTGLGEVLNKDDSKRATIMRQYQELIRNYKKSLRAAGTTIAKNAAEGERLYTETKTAYGWNQAYMQNINSYHYPYVKKFKKVSDRYFSVANRLRDDAVAASADLH